MAIIKCPECGAEVSDLATVCPQCGSPLTARTGSVTKNSYFQSSSAKRNLIIIGSIVAGVLFLFIVRTIYVKATIDYTYDKTMKEYNKAVDRATKDINRTLRQFGY